MDPMQRCVCFNVQGYCTSCEGKCHWTDHIKSNVDYEECEYIEEVPITTKTEAKGEAQEKQKASAALIVTYVGKIIEIVGELEGIQIKMKRCHEFLQENAARPTPYIATDYYEEQIAALKTEGKDGYLQEVKQLEEMVQHQKAIEHLTKGNVGTGKEADGQLTTIHEGFSKFKQQFLMYKEEIEEKKDYTGIFEWCEKSGEELMFKPPPKKKPQPDQQPQEPKEK